MSNIAPNEQTVKDMLTSEIQISLARLLDLNRMTDIKSQKIRLDLIEQLFRSLEALNIL